MSGVIIVLFAHTGYDRGAAGLLGAGRRLADSTGEALRVLCLGRADEALVGSLAGIADSVTLVDCEYQPEESLDLVANYCREGQGAAILLGNDTWSQEIAPRLAHRLGGSAVGDAIGVMVDGETGQLRVRRSVYGGKAVASIEPRRSPAVLWIRARAFEPVDGRGVSGTIERLGIPSPYLSSPTRIIERSSEATGEVRLEDARVIVSGGRGLGGAEPFVELEALAKDLGGLPAASRAACDSGWCPPGWQVGQTGKKVAPGLYLAIAIRGASQHLAGISEAKVVAAINNDAEAPIFKHCRFGIVEDYRKVIPLLREKLAQS